MRARARALGATAISSNERGAGEEDGSRAEDVGARARADCAARLVRQNERTGGVRWGGACSDRGCLRRRMCARAAEPAGRPVFCRAARGRGAPSAVERTPRLGAARQERCAA
ncbi:hypothetical protein GUJ93_ZPchr0458g22338 [Zizania palustris]|uniref:Uncharacterized protein n=1 Tax=Zizania palustris TaxID=103762 RepID=A0A8J5V2M6_ZIZPA|nr:hypothetical protein GUJ93_ZPchr0458g22338 [Zizania palustris]